MRTSLLKLSALAAILLSTVSCTKVDDQPAAVPTADVSYRFENRSVDCQASATTSRNYSGNDSTEDVSITLYKTPEGQVNSPTLIVTYERPGGQPTAAYQLTMVTYLSGRATDRAVFFDHMAGTLRETNGGFFEGTFTNTKPGSSPLSEGRFTHVPVFKRY